MLRILSYSVSQFDLVPIFCRYPTTRRDQVGSCRHFKMGLFTTNLRGKSLTRLLGVVGALAFTLQGYDQSLANGLLTLTSFIKVFPQIDTSNSSLSDSQKSHNSTIQGTSASTAAWKVYLMILDFRHDCSSLRGWSCAGGIVLCLPRRLVRAAEDMLLAGCTCIVGIIIQASPFSLGQLIAGRIITGETSFQQEVNSKIC
jgi:hypothetical protein